MASTLRFPWLQSWTRHRSRVKATSHQTKPHHHAFKTYFFLFHLSLEIVHLRGTLDVLRCDLEFWPQDLLPPSIFNIWGLNSSTSVSNLDIRIFFVTWMKRWPQVGHQIVLFTWELLSFYTKLEILMGSFHIINPLALPIGTCTHMVYNQYSRMELVSHNIIPIVHMYNDLCIDSTLAQSWLLVTHV